MNDSQNNDQDRWDRLWHIFHEAREKDPSTREAYLKEICGSDLELKNEVEELLATESKEAGILTRGVAPDVTQGIGPGQWRSEIRPGDILVKRYQIVELLGEGGMGTVYKAIDNELGRQVALEFLNLKDPTWSRRFLLEARVQARMEHPHICKVYEVGEVLGKQYIAMQFIPGKTMLEAYSGFSIKQKVQLMKQVCEAVHAAHQMGVIHRDIKPSNILVGLNDSGDFIPYVTDFGLARELTTPGMTSTGMVMGTAWYMAPEQARGEVRHLDAKCDIHALGATLYEFLCGKPPYEGDNSLDVLVKVINEEPLPLRQHNPHLPAELETIVQKCLQKEPSRRYESSAALAQDLNRFLEGEPILARPITWSHRAIKRVKKYPIISGLLAAAFVAVVTVAALAAWTWWHAQAQARLANEFEQEVRYMEDTARHAYTQPIHDIRAEEAVVEKRLSAIEKRVEEAGAAAEGPGNFAMGRGYMALYRYPEARTHLEIAWNEYRIPRVAFALGLTLGLIYQKEFDRASRIPDPQAREQKKAEIDKDLKEPALRFIKEGNSAVEAPEFVEALISFLDKRYEEALKKTQIAFQKQPWFFEAKKLEADVLRTMANEKRNAGDPQSAAELYKKAETAYRQALREGSSYALGYGSLCALGYDWTSLMLFQTGIPNEELLQKSVEACNNSLKVNPDRPEAYIAKCALKNNWGDYHMTRGLDPTQHYQDSIDACGKALKWDWVRFAAYNNMGGAHSSLSSYQMRMGKDATNALDQAIESYNRALKLNPDNPYFHNNLAISYARKAGYENQNGRNPTSIQDEAIKEFREAVRIDPTDVKSVSNLGEIYFEKALYEYQIGGDPRSSIETSKTNLKKAIEMNSSFFLAYNTLSEIYRLEALQQIEKGDDPKSLLEEALNVLKKGTDVNPQNVDGFIKEASISALVVETNRDDPLNYLTRAREALKKADELAPKMPEVYAAKAEVDAASTRFNISRGKLKEAKADLDQGLKNAGEIISENERAANGYALKGRLLLRQAQITASQSEKQKLAQSSNKMFQQAFRLYPGLSKNFATDVAELKRLL